MEVDGDSATQQPSNQESLNQQPPQINAGTSNEGHQVAQENAEITAMGVNTAPSQHAETSGQQVINDRRQVSDPLQINEGAVENSLCSLQVKRPSEGCDDGTDGPPKKKIAIPTTFHQLAELLFKYNDNAIAIVHNIWPSANYRTKQMGLEDISVYIASITIDGIKFRGLGLRRRKEAYDHAARNILLHFIDKDSFGVTANELPHQPRHVDPELN